MPDLIVRPGRMRLTRTVTNHTRGGRERERKQREFAVRGVSMPKAEPHAVVKVQVGRTYNLGAYESLRLEVGIELPTPVAEVEPASERAMRFCQQKLLDYQHEAFGGEDD